MKISYQQMIGVFLGFSICIQCLAVEWWEANPRVSIDQCQLSQTSIDSGGCSGSSQKKAPTKIVVHIGKIRPTEEMTGSGSLAVRCIDGSTCVETTVYDFNSGEILCKSNSRNDFFGYDKEEFPKIKAQVTKLISKCSADLQREKDYENKQHQLQLQLNSRTRTPSQAGHGGIRDTYHFELSSGVQVICNDGFKDVIDKMESGGWYYSGRSYDAEYAAAAAVCQ